MLPWNIFNNNNNNNNKSGSTMCQLAPYMGQVGTRAEVRRSSFFLD
jgi:hypothetical protein